MSLQKWSIGFIGLGLMGKPMARHLHHAKAKLFVHNRSLPVVHKLQAEGMQAPGSIAGVAQAANVVILMLSDTPAVQAVCAELLPHLKAGQIIIDMGTTAVSVTRSLATQVAAKGGHWVDAPVSGGELGARNATLSIMAGGEEVIIERLRPVFAVLGQRLTHVGAVGAGQVAKAANQVIVGLTIGAVAEALSLASAAGVDPAKVREALRGGFADSRILELHGQRMVEHNFRPGGRSVTQRKDLQQALELAHSLNLALPATELCRDLYDRLIAQGDGELDHSALIRVLEIKGKP